MSVGLVAWAYSTRPETPSAADAPGTPAAGTEESRDDDADPGGTPPPTCREVLERTGKDPIGTCRAASGTLLTIGVQNRPLLVGPLTARVLSTAFERASTPEGQARNRARVTVRVTLLNHSPEPVDVDWTLLDLSIGGLRVNPDRNAARLPGGWRIGVIEPRDRRTGELRFEIAGRATARLVQTGRADLALRVEKNRIGVIRLRVQAE